MASSRLHGLLAALGMGALAVLVFMASVRPIEHDDVFWHLRTAEWVLEKGEVPRVDHYTHTVAGEAWTSHEWGFALVLYGPYRLFGFAGLVGLTALLTLLAFAFTYAQMRRYLTPARASLAIPLLLLAWSALLRSGLVLRAGLLSSALLAGLCALLERLHHTRDRRFMVPIVALIWFWANCHTAVVFGLAMIAAHTVQACFDLWRERPPAFWAAAMRGIPAERALLLVGSAALTLVNPNGVDLWTFPFRLNALLYRSDLTWAMGQFASPSLRNYPYFYLTVASVLAACLPLSRLRMVLADTRKPAIAQSLGMLFFLGMALRSNRFIMDFVVMALPLLAMIWGTEAPAGTTTKLGRFWSSPWSHACNIALVAAVAALLRPSWPRQALADNVPQALASFMETEHIAGRMFNYEAVGGYLGLRLRQPVYWDGRCDIFGEVAKEFAETEDFGALFARHGVDMLVVNAGYYGQFRTYLDSHRALWGLAYLDDRFALLLRRVPKFQGALERWEYRLLTPFRLPSEEEVHRAALDPALAEQTNGEATRLLAQNPQTFLGWYVRGELARERGDLPAAQEALSRAVQLIENSEVLYGLARVARDLGRPEEARRLLERAIALTQH